MRLSRSLVAASLVALALPASAHAAFPGANGRIAYVERSGIDSSDALVSIRPDGSGRELLAGDFVADPNFSADGSMIAHSVMGSIDVNGQTIETPGLEAAYSPSFSPDGSRLVFVGQTDVLDIYTMRLDGSDLRRLTSGPRRDWSPQWSPDGRHIVHESDAGLQRMRPDGSGRTALTSNGAAPDWSPDSRKIVFSRVASGRTEIWTMNADGSSRVRVGYGQNPNHSPDGTKILASDYNRGLFTIPARGGTAKRIFTSTTFKTGSSTWQPLP